MNSILNRIKTNFKKNKMIILIFMVIWIAASIITLYGYRNTLGRESLGNLEYNYVEVLNSNKSITQIIDTYDGVDSVSVRLEVYKKNNSTVTIKVIGKDSNELYGEKTMKIKNVIGASFNTVGLSEKLDSKKDSKIAVIVSTDDNNDAIGVWCSFNNVFDNDMLINGVVKEGSISARVLYQTDMFNGISNTIISLLITFNTLMILYMLLFDAKKEIIYTLMVLFYGLLFIFVLTPLSGPDEEYHYRVSLIISNKFLGKENPNLVEDVFIGYFPNFECNFNVGAAYRDVLENITKPMPDLAGRRIYELNRGYTYLYDFCYYPQVIGITIGRLLNLNFFGIYYLGRLCGVLFYTICVYVSLKKAPILKDLIGVVALLPINLQQSVCYSMDMWICALSLVIFACFLQWMFGKEKISKIDFIFVLAVEALLAPAKIVYSLFILLFWFVPENKFYSKKHKTIVLTLLMLPMAYYVGINIFERIRNNIVASIHAEDFGTATTHELNQVYTLKYIITHPIKSFAIVVRTIAKDLKSWFAGAIGRYLSGLTLILPAQIAHCLVILLVIAPLINESQQLSNIAKISSLGVCILIGMLTIAVMLTGCTDVEDEYVQGIQGRYFTPMLPYVFVILNNKYISIPKKYSNLLVLAVLLVLFESVIYMLSATFVY